MEAVKGLKHAVKKLVMLAIFAGSFCEDKITLAIKVNNMMYIKTPIQPKAILASTKNKIGRAHV